MEWLAVGGIPTKRKPEKVAKGRLRPGAHYRNCGINFDVETYEQIVERAVREGTSFSEQVRLLVEWGLEAESPNAWSGR